MKLCRKYPISFDGYCNIHKKTFDTSEGIVGRYQKACFVYSAFKYIEHPDNRNIAAAFQDLISKPIDAFYIWWDI